MTELSPAAIKGLVRRVEVHVGGDRQVGKLRAARAGGHIHTQSTHTLHTTHTHTHINTT